MPVRRVVVPPPHETPIGFRGRAARFEAFEAQEAAKAERARVDSLAAAVPKPSSAPLVCPPPRRRLLDAGDGSYDDDWAYDQAWDAEEEEEEEDEEAEEEYEAEEISGIQILGLALRSEEPGQVSV